MSMVTSAYNKKYQNQLTHIKATNAYAQQMD
jgi:hypothetical protein